MPNTFFFQIVFEVLPRFSFGCRPRVLHRLLQLVLERCHHVRHLLQDVALLLRRRQLPQELQLKKLVSVLPSKRFRPTYPDVVEVVETVVDRPQQQLGQVELDGLPESLPARPERVRDHPVGQQRVQGLPGGRAEDVLGVLVVHVEFLGLGKLLEAGTDGRNLVKIS